MQMQFLALGYIFVHRRCNIGKQAIYVTLILCLNVISFMLFLTCYFCFCLSSVQVSGGTRGSLGGLLGCIDALYGSPLEPRNFGNTLL